MKGRYRYKDTDIDIDIDVDVDECVNQIKDSFHNVYVNQTIMMYTLNILQFYLLIISQ